MGIRMRESERRVETVAWTAAPVRVRDLVGYGALIVAPHPDDEVLGCGGLLASARRPDAIEVLVLTDGALSPPAAVGDPGLVALRREESLGALDALGISERYVSFAGLPDGELSSEAAELDRELRDAATRTSATDVFVPFRFDRHPDHVATYAAGERLARRAGVRLWEYFVYPFWRLLPRGDVRAHLRPGTLYALELDGGTRAAQRAALELYRSQTEPWGGGPGRPVLSPKHLDRVCAGPEVYLRHEVARPGAAVLKGTGAWFQVARRVEPGLKRAKDALLERRGRA
ncbi:MAG TPA: PIG-L deacetylase family protein [Gemmatimonadota bacterium]|nr:PIG-L deacetylase family protein [Gemmatimonadota bacterium]